MSAENLKLWNSVKETPPSMTKTDTISGRKVTSIDAYYQIEQATKKFGSYGKGWGLKEIETDYKQIGDTTLCTMKAIFFYDKYQFPIINAIKVAYVTKGGSGYLKIDEDFAKKLETNTLTKALSKLGFNADIFMGKFEDGIYLQEQRRKEKIRKTPISKMSMEELLFDIRQILSSSSDHQIVADMLNAKKAAGEIDRKLLENTLKDLRNEK